ncbi:MAG: peptidase S10 [Phenylobacterium sp.]|uniref:S10 family peptidase n=1 Tax=Phenylobacterium sp. TaxID=1871053 RepID=UPI0027261569|nr:peptidase S10 [Phenylobacterium sp.]MDO8901641.1 peptidase S10 [Phenylobacterium sp.]MDP2213448.1 peptidase S10 [Phenylobacterium sp.]
MRTAARLLAAILGVGLLGVAPAPSQAEPTARSFVTQHAGVFGGRRVSYEAIAGETILRDAKGAPAATLFSFSYVEKAAPSNRPVIFIFNGGPGSSSVWLHLGMAGPRQVDFTDEVNPPTVPPFALKDNPNALLDVADLVFIDPPGTGYSRVLPTGRTEDYYGVNQDALAVANFMSAWLSRNNRWNSPKFVMGESYGTTRAAALATTLMGGPTSASGELGAITLNGVLVLGPAMGGPVGDHLYGANLPAMAASAWYHRPELRQGRGLDEAVEAARTLASGPYMRALYLGSALPAADRLALADQLAALTGVPAQTWLANRLRLGLGGFSRELLKDKGLQVGAYDSRYVLPLKAAGADPVADDPAMGQYTPAFVGALNGYVVKELKVRMDTPYIPIAFTQVNSKWDYGPGGPRGRDAAAELAQALRRNPSLRLFVAAGHYDLVTTVGAAEYALSQVDLPANRVTLKAYPSGHMPYLGAESARTLAEDVRAFIRRAAQGSE